MCNGALRERYRHVLLHMVYIKELVSGILYIDDLGLSARKYILQRSEKEETLCVRGNRPNSARVNILRQMTMNGHKKRKRKKKKNGL